MNCLKNYSRRRDRYLACAGRRRSGRRKVGDSHRCVFKIICARSSHHKYGLEVPQIFWSWAVPMDALQERHRLELGYSRPPVRRVTEWSTVFFDGYSWNRAVLHKIFSNTNSAATATAA